MKEWFSEYWYLVIMLFGAMIVAAFAFRFAAKAYGKYRSAYRSQEAEIKRLTALKERFVPLTSEKLFAADNSEILEGVALSYQLQLQKCNDMEGAFLLLSEEKRYIYILDVFVSDASLLVFMRENSDILRMEICKALKLIGMDDFSDMLEPIRKMYDKNDEVTSLDEKEVEKTDLYITQKNILTQIKLNGAEYIKNNYVAFVN